MKHCRHCGNKNGAAAVTTGEDTFCCQGCATVHDLLNARGLGDYYELETEGAIPIPQTVSRESLQFLDTPALRDQLLDFSDGQQASVRFHIPNLHCAACVWLLEHLYEIDERVGETRVNLLTKQVTIRFHETELPFSELVYLLHTLGYPPNLNRGQTEETTTRPIHRARLLKVGIAGFAFGNIMLLSVPHYLGLVTPQQAMLSPVLRLLPLLISLPVLTYCASDYWRAAWMSWKQRRMRVEVPIALGLVALAVESTVISFTQTGPGYWDSLAGLVFFLLCGQWFKERSLDHLSFTQDYRQFFPLSVRRRERGHVTTVPLSELAVGDHVEVRYHELIPADAQLVSAAAQIDYSFVTGESDPVAATKGTGLFAGGRNVGATIELQIQKPVSESYLTSLWNHHGDDHEVGTKIPALTDQVSRVFTPVVLLIATLSALFWAGTSLTAAVHQFAAVLIIACPCALALAAPFACGTAILQLGRRAIHLKNSLVIERLAQISTVVFDKTGTLTSTRQQRSTYQGTPLSFDESNAVATLAQQSPHPYSQQIAASLSTADTDLAVETFAEQAGAGVRGQVQGRTIVYGSLAWLDTHGISGLPPAPNPQASLVALAINGQFRGYFVLSADYRSALPTMISELGQRFQLLVASGDTPRDESRLRGLFGKNAQFNFQQSPYDKQHLIAERQEQNEHVLFIGDGLNDAGALRTADVGLAVLEDQSQFTPASDGILPANALGQLPQVLRFARGTVTVIWLSFAAAFAYNAIGITLAATGQLSPLAAAILMPISSLTITLLSTGMTILLARRHLQPISESPEQIAHS